MWMMPASLELHDLGVGDLARLPELGDREVAVAGEGALQGDVEPAPQLGRVPLPDHVSGVVVAVRAERGPEPVVVLVVAGVAPQRPPVRAEGLVAAGPAGSLVAEPVDRSERGGGEGGERARVLGDRGGDALAAGQAGGDQLPGIALVSAAARLAGRCATVPARDPGGAVELQCGGISGADLAGGGVDQPCRAAEPDRAFAAVDPPAGGVDPGLAEHPARRRTRNDGDGP
jgi:hypothetical protein